MYGEHPGPSRWSYILAALIVLGGLVTFGVFLFTGLTGATPAIQVIVPGRSELRLTEPGEYTVFHEYQTLIGGQVYSTSAGLDLECRLASAASGSSIPLAGASASTTYSIGGRSGRSIWEFGIAEPGGYALDCSYASGAEGPETVLAIGHGTLEKIVTVIFGGIGILFASVAAGGVIAVFTLSKRQQADRLSRGLPV